LTRKTQARARAPSIRIALDVAVDDAGWRKEIADPAPLLRRAARRAIAASQRGRRHPAAFSIGVALIADAAMRRLNRRYRGKDKPTNVLSFMAEPRIAVPGRGGKPRPHRELGDIAIALGVVRREAKAQGKSVKDHLAHLMVHAVLHLLGYDHEDDAEADRMEAVERRALAAMGIADPYRSRG
jgi:probable rRNA maturation factor